MPSRRRPSAPPLPAVALLCLVAAGCAAAEPPRTGPVLPAREGRDLEPAAKARRIEAGLDALHLLPWGGLAYRVRVPVDEGAPVRTWYLSDQAAWTGVLLGAEAERWAATGEEEARRRVLHLLRGLATLSAVTGERGAFARYARAPGVPEREGDSPHWHDGASGHDGWRWRGDLSKDQVAGMLYGLAAVTDLVEDPAARARAAVLLGDLADRVLARGLRIEDPDGVPTTYGDLSPTVAGLPIGVNAAIVLGLADAAARATGEGRHRRALERLLRAGAAGALRFPTLRVLGKENWNNANMVAMALASVLRLPPDPADGHRVALRAAAEDSLRRILDLHRGEGNAFWIAVAAPAGAAAGADAAELAAARAALARFPVDGRDLPVDHRGRADLEEAFWRSRRGRTRLVRPLPVDEMGAGSFVWKSDPFEALQEAEGDGRNRYSGIDFLAAYWPLRRLGLRP